MSFLVLTKAQADAVRGESAPGAALMPVELADGTFCLPDAVLTDPAHAKKLGILATLNKTSAVTPKTPPEAQ